MRKHSHAIAGCTVITALLLSACAPSVKPIDEAAAVERGQALAQASFQALSGRLKQAMAEGGPAHAVAYCNTAALPLVDSLSQVHGARIKRTSLKLRAPHDAPDPAEREQLEAYARSWSEGGEPLKPKAVAHGVDSVAFYAPIFIQAPLCLACHGVAGETLDSTAHAAIRTNYPDDEATGYALGDLRGLWSIRWKRPD